MENEYRYILEKGSRKHLCPDCGKKRFVRYIDTKTGEYLPEQYGRCDKGDGHYFLNPYTDGYAKMIWEQENKVISGTNITIPKKKFFHRSKPKPEPEPVFFNFETFKRTLQGYEQNGFIQNLLHRVSFPFGSGDITNIIQLYRLGTITAGYRAGAITFPFIDEQGNVRTIQVKQFDKLNHTTGTDFLHSIIEKDYTRNNKRLPEWLKEYIQQDKRVTCLFGEHLLKKYPNNPVALVEAPKTAIYGTLYFGLPESPESLIWLAVYNKSSFSFDKMKALKGRYIYVFPDLSKDGGTFQEWKDKANKFETNLPGTRFIFSDLLERLAPEQERNKGGDLADFLIKQDWREYRKRETIKADQEPEQLEPLQVKEKLQPAPTPIKPQEQQEQHKTSTAGHKDSAVWIKTLKQMQSENWNNEIFKLESFFDTTTRPSEPIKLNDHSTITNIDKFIDSHLCRVKGNNGNKTFLPYLHRLQDLKEYLQNTKP